MFSLKVQTRVGQVWSCRIAARRSPRTAKSADYGEEKKNTARKKKENVPFRLSSPERRARSEACGGGQAGREDAASPEPWGRRRGCVGSCCPALTGSGSCSRRASGRRQPGGLSLHPLLLVALLGLHGAGGGKIPAQRVRGDSCRKPVGGHGDLESLLRLWEGSCSPSRTDEAFCPNPAAPTSVQHLHGAAFLHLHHLQSRSGTATPAPRSMGMWWQMSPTTPLRDRGCGTTQSPSAPPAAPHSP